MSLLGKSQGVGGCVVDGTDGNEPELLYGRGGQPSVAVSGEIFFFGERDEDLLGLSKADEDLVLLPEQLFGNSDALVAQRDSREGEPSVFSHPKSATAQENPHFLLL